MNTCIHHWNPLSREGELKKNKHKIFRFRFWLLLSHLGNLACMLAWLQQYNDTELLAFLTELVLIQRAKKQIICEIVHTVNVEIYCTWPWGMCTSFLMGAAQIHRREAGRDCWQCSLHFARHVKDGWEHGHTAIITERVECSCFSYFVAAAQNVCNMEPGRNSPIHL